MSTDAELALLRECAIADAAQMGELRTERDRARDERDEALSRVARLEALLRGLPEWAEERFGFPWMTSALRTHIEAGMGEVGGG